MTTSIPKLFLACLRDGIVVESQLLVIHIHLKVVERLRRFQLCVILHLELCQMALMKHLFEDGTSPLVKHSLEDIEPTRKREEPICNSVDINSSHILKSHRVWNDRCEQMRVRF